jgi:SP family sugar porter-like MFS transporter
MLVSVLIGIALYAMTLAPTTWVVLSEIFPNKIRGVAMSIATMSLWSACFILTYAFPILNSWTGPSGTFWIFALICIGGFVFIKKRLPETKGKTLEEIEQEI